MNALLAVLWKDLVTEWRSRDRVVAMAVFALLVVVVLYFAAPPGPGAGAEARAHVPGLLWVAWIFAAVLGLGRSFTVELENEALSGLAMAPAERGFLYLGKALANFVLLALVQGLAAGAFGLAFGWNLWPVALPLAGVALLGGVGICSIGTLFAAMAVRTATREVMLPLLLLPLLVPVLLGAVRATSALLLEDALPWASIQLLLVTDGVYLIVSFLGFEVVLDE